MKVAGKKPDTHSSLLPATLYCPLALHIISSLLYTSCIPPANLVLQSSRCSHALSCFLCVFLWILSVATDVGKSLTQGSATRPTFHRPHHHLCRRSCRVQAQASLMSGSALLEACKSRASQIALGLTMASSLMLGMNLPACLTAGLLMILHLLACCILRLCIGLPSRDHFDACSSSWGHCTVLIKWARPDRYRT